MLIDRLYRPVLQASLRIRYITVAAAIAVLTVVVSYSTSFAHGHGAHAGDLGGRDRGPGCGSRFGTTPDQAAAVAEAVHSGNREVV